jgi:hypothetical protein
VDVAAFCLIVAAWELGVILKYFFSLLPFLLLLAGFGARFYSQRVAHLYFWFVVFLGHFGQLANLRHLFWFLAALASSCIILLDSQQNATSIFGLLRRHFLSITLAAISSIHLALLPCWSLPHVFRFAVFGFVYFG